MFASGLAVAEQLTQRARQPMTSYNHSDMIDMLVENILAEGAIALSVTLSGGVLFAS
jgi:hypothetical protein